MTTRSPSRCCGRATLSRHSSAIMSAKLADIAAVAGDRPCRRHRTDTTTLARRCVILAPSLTRIIRHPAGRVLSSRYRTRDRRQRLCGLQTKEKPSSRIWEVSQQKYAAIEDAFGRAEMRDLVVSLNSFRACLESDGAPGRSCRDRQDTSRQSPERRHARRYREQTRPSR